MSKKKICVSILAFIIIMLTATIVHAASTPPDSFSFNEDKSTKNFATSLTQIDGWWIMCMEKGGHLHDTKYYGNPGVGYTTGWRRSNPWGGAKKWQSYFTRSGQIDMKPYQDTMYAIIHAQEHGIDVTQELLWATSLNKGDIINIDKNNETQLKLYEEARAYKRFYDSVQKEGGYNPKDVTNYNQVKVYVNSNPQENYYVAGPFSIKYLDDYYDNYRVRFGEISKIRVLNETDEELKLLDITNAKGESILHRKDDEERHNYKYPVSEELFYVKFRSNELDGSGAGQYISLDVEFNYLKECKGTLYEYEGRNYQWYYEKTSSKRVHNTGHTSCHNEYKYTLRRTSDPAQILVAYAKDGEEVWSKAKLRMGLSNTPTPGDDTVDISMKISGYVFLDHDNPEKGNNRNDKKDDGEVLKGVEVTLYEVGVGKAQVSAVHRHIGDPKKGGGCFTIPVYHQHTSACYDMTSHQHTDECKIPIYHVHDYTCVSDASAGSLICGFNYEHKHDSSCYNENGEKICGKEEHFHTDECYKTICGIEEHVHSCYSSVNVCGKTEHTHSDTCSRDEQGNITCPIEEHTHTDNCKLVCTKEAHEHSDSCYNENGEQICGKAEHMHVDNSSICYDSTGNFTCTKEVHEHSVGNGCYDFVYDCGRTPAKYDKDGNVINHPDIDYYRLTCAEDMSKYKLKCGKVAAEYDKDGNITNGIDSKVPKDKKATVDSYRPGCTIGCKTGYGAAYEKIESTIITGEDGYYEFKHLDPMKKYYIRFAYNGMLYTNIETIDPKVDNSDITKSRAAEDDMYIYNDRHRYEYTNALNKHLVSEHMNTRQPFNSQFAEIGSWPENYNSSSYGKKNQTYMQEEIVDEFEKVINGGDALNTSGDSKLSFAKDCKIFAYTQSQYPLYDQFILDDGDDIDLFDKGTTYYATYRKGGPGDQLNVNLGIKARPAFDLALYKDVFKATLNINGKEEVYKYDYRDAWKDDGFGYQVNENYYIEALRRYYMGETKDKSEIKQNYDKSTSIANDGNGEGEYVHEYRTEEIINGDNTKYNWLNESTLYGNRTGYAWRKINHNLTDVNDKLQIHVTYKIKISNQSNVAGSVTEIVDYYDDNYEFENAYVGLEDGTRLPNNYVYVREEDGTELQRDKEGWPDTPDDKYITKTGSMYGTNTQHIAKPASGINGKWSVDDTNTREYKALYINTTEQKLYGDNKDQYIYITFGLNDPEKTLIDAGVPFGKRFYTYNMAEINGYKTYGYESDGASMGIIDKDSNPGNFNPNNYKFGTELEDDTSRAPAYAYTIRQSRTLEGNVFEDMLANNATASKEKYVVAVNTTRFGDGEKTIAKNIDKNIAGIKVELIEIKDGNMIVRQDTTTNSDGWYGFGAFLPGNYTIRFTYGADDKTVLTKDNPDTKTINEASQYTTAGENYTSYNGQDYQSTIFASNAGKNADNTEEIYINENGYYTDSDLSQKYKDDYDKRDQEQETIIKEQPNEKMNIKTYYKQIKDNDGNWVNVNYYWYSDQKKGASGNYIRESDAKDDAARREEVIKYSTDEYGRKITNHKAEVFNSYINQATLRDYERDYESEPKQPNFNKFTQAQPMDEDVDSQENNRKLVDELERRTYMYAYTPELPVEVEYAKTQVTGNQSSDKYDYLITGVDFGVVERPRAQLTIDQDIEYIKVTASNGNTLLELENEGTDNKFKVIVNNEDNHQWPIVGDFVKYDKEEIVNIIMDDELLSGARLEVRYRFTVKNNSEVCTDIANTLNTTNTSRAVNIINYVANNLNFDVNDNKDNAGNGLWEVVNKEDIQKGSKSTLINNDTVDLSTQTTILKATANNPLTEEIAPGDEPKTATLTLKKVLSSESSADDLKYTNMTEIVEIDNEVGRYDHGAIPGNQKLDEQPREHDTSGASRTDEDANIPYKPDGKIIITPPTGDTKIYYVLAAGIAVLVLAGVILIKKFVLGGKE